MRLRSTGAARESRAQHEHGWNACLDNLASRVLT
jgi:hypothetical protein